MVFLLRTIQNFSQLWSQQSGLPGHAIQKGFRLPEELVEFARIRVRHAFHIICQSPPGTRESTPESSHIREESLTTGTVGNRFLEIDHRSGTRVNGPRDGLDIEKIEHASWLVTRRTRHVFDPPLRLSKISERSDQRLETPPIVPVRPRRLQLSKSGNAGLYSRTPGRSTTLLEPLLTKKCPASKIRQRAVNTLQDQVDCMYGGSSKLEQTESGTP